MNDLVQNKIVEQKDILKIIGILNDFYQEKNEIFSKTKANIEAEEQAYAEWNKERFNSNNISAYPEFVYQTHNNKLVYQNFTFSFYCEDGLSYEDKSYSEGQIILNSGYASFEKITIRLDMTWNKTYNSRDFSYSESNNANVSVTITIREDDIYTNYTSKNADGDMKFLKSEITDVFEGLKPKYSNLISKRESIKYNSTLAYAYLMATVIITVATFVFNNSGVEFAFDWWQIIAFIPVSLVCNMFIPAKKLTNLYKLILPSKKTVYEGKELKKVDNIKEFKRTAEVHIGKNAFKAGKREQIIAIQKKSKSLNLIALVFSIVVVFVVSIIF